MNAIPNLKRVFAVVPAAGLSRRMGRPKLLLPWRGRTIIDCLLDVLASAAIAETVVVVRPDDEPLQQHLRQTSAHVVVPTQAPPDMRDSVELALADIERRHSPRPEDLWLLIPADHPLLDKALLHQMVEFAQNSTGQILVPTHQGKRGHPTVFPWSLSAAVASIPADQGLNWLLHQQPDRVLEVDVHSPGILADLDTPADYQQLQTQWPDFNAVADNHHDTPPAEG